MTYQQLSYDSESEDEEFHTENFKLVDNEVLSTDIYEELETDNKEDGTSLYLEVSVDSEFVNDNALSVQFVINFTFKNKKYSQRLIYLNKKYRSKLDKKILKEFIMDNDCPIFFSKLGTDGEPEKPIISAIRYTIKKNLKPKEYNNINNIDCILFLFDSPCDLNISLKDIFHGNDYMRKAYVTNNVKQKNSILGKLIINTGR